MSETLVETKTPTQALMLPSISNLPAVIEPEQESKIVVAVERFTLQQRALVEKVAAAVDFDDPQVALTFAIVPRTRYKETLERLATGIKVEDAGPAGDMAITLMKGIDAMEIKKMKEEAQGKPWYVHVKGIPVIGGWIYRSCSRVHVFTARKQEFVTLVKQMEEEAKGKMRKIQENNTRSKMAYDAAEANYRELAVYIVAGRLAYERGKEEYQRLYDIAQSGDAVDAQRANVLYEQLISFQTKLVALQQSYVSAPVTGQQILMTMQSGKIEMENTMESIVSDLPKIYQAIINVTNLVNIKKAQEGTDKRKELARKMQDIDTGLLEEVTVKAKENQMRGLKEVQDLENYANSVISNLRKIAELNEQVNRTNVEAVEQLKRIQETITVGISEATRPQTLS